MKNMKFTLIGGDLRNVKLAALLEERGNEVYTFGLEGGAGGKFFYRCNSMTEAFARGDIIIGPIPFSQDGIKLNAPLHQADVELQDILDNIPKGRLLIAGKVPADFARKLADKNVKVIDIMDRDDMAILNSIPTAEGAVQIAMEELPVTIHNCKVMVLGLGKVGLTLAVLLKNIGAKVLVVVRNSRDISRAAAFGLECATYEELPLIIGEYKLLYNTVPAMVLDKNVLQFVAKDALIIDLASKPGGVDFEYAQYKGIKTIHALSLPGKVAPVTTAMYMETVIYNIIKEEYKGGI
ncbi:MAG: dipicolinate synthase subunit DpsA [Clostridiaceae bacterium]|nr:dipicolinate synthase subunit DpsA [Clostridiaceae bacterium]